MPKTVVEAIDAQVAATREMYDAILTCAHEVTGIANRKGEEPGVVLIKDVDYQVTNRLNFLHTNYANRKDWAESAIKRANDAERLKLEVESIKDQLDDKKTRDDTDTHISEFETVFTQELIAQRYAEIGVVRWEQMNREFSMLCELYEEMNEKEFVPSTTKAGNSPGNTTVNPEALKKAMASRGIA